MTTTSSEEVSGLGSVAKCARLLGGNVGALGNVAKDVNKMCCEQMDGAGRAAKETEKTSNLRTTFVAKVVGAAFVLVGFGGFFLFQLPRRH